MGVAVKLVIGDNTTYHLIPASILSLFQHYIYKPYLNYS